VGDNVQAGEVVLVLEAMKMQNSIVAPANGTLVSTHCEQGQMVRKGALLAVIV
jgi:biotin carboxyl carrier protein